METIKSEAEQRSQVAAPNHAAPAIGASNAPELDAMREDQVESAVAFLSHPKVRDSSTNSKRTFLERKGLTAAEIDEAFNRVPQSAPTSAQAQPAAPTTVSPASPYAASQPAQAQVYRPFPPQQPSQQQSLPLSHAAPLGLQLAPPRQPGLRWTQVVLGVGVTAGAVVAVQHYVYPFLAARYTQLTSKSRERLEVVQQREQQLLETLKELQASQKELQEHLKSFTGVVKSLKDEVETVRHSSSRGYPADFRNGPDNSSPWMPPGDNYSNLPRDETSLRPNWTRYGETQSASGYWASNGAARGGLHGFKRVVQEENWRGAATASSTASPPASESCNPSYAEVVEMLQKGITPPNVRADINDQPPDPSRPFSESRALPSTKPWQRSAGWVSSDCAVRPATPPFPAPPTPSPYVARTALGPSSFPPPDAPPTDIHQTAAFSGSSVSITSSVAVQNGMASSALTTGGATAGRAAAPATWRPPPPPAPTVSFQPSVSPSATHAGEVRSAGEGLTPATTSPSTVVSGTSETAAAHSLTNAIAAEVGSDV